MKILGVDDSRLTRKMLRDVVESLEYEFIEAADGKEAIEQIEKHQNELNLILLDWNIPEPDGYEVLQWAKHKCPELPVMMVTAMGQQEKVLKALKAGVNDYVAKPFSKEDLARKIQDIALKK
jgi:two-component system, chemotaxis family, chemotaxis protein CheY